MHTIKKYANRKLYHTNRKQYITLDGIAQLVQAGEPVQVIDNESAEDITPAILAQVVLQARGRHGSPLPTTLLTGLIQVGGDTLSGLRRGLFLSLGGIALIEAEIERRIDALVESGHADPDQAERWRTLLLSADLHHSPETDLAEATPDIPSRNDVVRLHSQVDALSEIVDQLLRGNTRRP